MGLAREEGSWLPAPLLLCPRPHAGNPGPTRGYPSCTQPACSGTSECWLHVLPSLCFPHLHKAKLP